MCIAILSTAHPDYPLILLDNRDEFLHRPTAQATWWPAPDIQVLGGYDLHQPAHGTWLGITRQGRIAVLTNYREENYVVDPKAPSRGLIPNAWLKSDPAVRQLPEEFARRMIEEGVVNGMGGFSLCYGYVQDVKEVKSRHRKGLAIISNRTPDVHGVVRVIGAAGETHALSNTAYGDRTWPKVLNGEILVQEAIQKSVAVNESREQLVEHLLGVLSTDTMPARKEGESLDTYMSQLRKSIFIPAIGRGHVKDETLQAESVGSGSKQETNRATTGGYGTQKHIVILVDKAGHVYYLERTLYDGNANALEPEQGDRVFEFDVEGW